MNVILKQKEIEAALKLYALQQGIQLAGKNVLISFTAGRKDTGISAELDIADKPDTVSFIDTLIEQQANAIVIPEIPEAPAPVVIPAVDRLTSLVEMEKVRQEADIEGVPEKLTSVFLPDAVTAEKGEVVEAIEEMPSIVNLFTSPFANSVAEPEEQDEYAADESDEPQDEEVVVAQPVKSVSLFG